MLIDAAGALEGHAKQVADAEQVGDPQSDAAARDVQHGGRPAVRGGFVADQAIRGGGRGAVARPATLVGHGRLISRGEEAAQFVVTERGSERAADLVPGVPAPVAPHHAGEHLGNAALGRLWDGNAKEVAEGEWLGRLKADAARRHVGDANGQASGVVVASRGAGGFHVTADAAPGSPLLGLGGGLTAKPE
ncbi:MAG: hypothetical protein U0736_19245 [Gemmataceae bacterium]